MESMDRGARGWLYLTARKNLWRVEGFCDFDDLIQEGMYCYYRIIKRYPHATEPKHRMRLFQIAFINYIHTLAKKRTRSREVSVIEADLGDLFDHVKNKLTTYEEAGVMLAQAPAFVRQIVEAFDTQSSEFRKPYRRRSGRRETTNQRVCRIAGLKYSNATNYMAELHSYLQTAITLRQSDKSAV